MSCAGMARRSASLDPEQVFYLRARGVARAKPKAMLLEAFGAEAIDRVEDDDLAERAARPAQRLARVTEMRTLMRVTFGFETGRVSSAN